MCRLLLQLNICGIEVYILYIYLVFLGKEQALQQCLLLLELHFV